MKKLSRNKKAISEMVSYVLLVVIAVGLAVIVYGYLKYYVPNANVPVCPYEVNLIIQDISCKTSPSKEISISLTNKGLFTVHAFYFRIGNATRAKTAINDGKKNTNYLPGFYFNLNSIEKGMLTGESTTKVYQSSTYPISFIAPGEYNIEIQPAVFVASSAGKKSLAICKESIISQTMSCT